MYQSLQSYSGWLCRLADVLWWRGEVLSTPILTSNWLGFLALATFANTKPRNFNQRCLTRLIPFPGQPWLATSEKLRAKQVWQFSSWAPGQALQYIEKRNICSTAALLSCSVENPRNTAAGVFHRYQLNFYMMFYNHKYTLQTCT